MQPLIPGKKQQHSTCDILICHPDLSPNQFMINNKDTMYRIRKIYKIDVFEGAILFWPSSEISCCCVLWMWMWGLSSAAPTPHWWTHRCRNNSLLGEHSPSHVSASVLIMNKKKLYYCHLIAGITLSSLLSYRLKRWHLLWGPMSATVVLWTRTSLWPALPSPLMPRTSSTSKR